MLRLLAVLPLLLMLAACAGDGAVDALRQVTPTAQGHSRELYQFYLALAQEEANEGRDANAALFARKGQEAAYGNPPAPEAPGNAPQALQEAYRALEAVLATGAASDEPRQAARLQTLYECWLLRTRADAPAPRQEYCQQLFYNYLARLRDRVQHAPGSEGKAEGQAALATSYLIYFEWDRAVLSREALGKLRAVAKELLAIKEPYTLVLNGHTDSSGTEEYNMKLSQKRAQRVRDLLVTLGVPSAIMQVFAFGETDLDVSTGDGVREAKNRRVEIFLE